MKSSNDVGKGRIVNVMSILLAAAIGVALPIVACSTQGDVPMIPINVEINSAVPISADLQGKLVAVTKDLIQKNLSEILAKSKSADASANILEKSPTRGYVIEVLVVSLFRGSYTAQMSRIEFAYQDDKVTLRKVEPSFELK
jgi:hypothetical protein